MKEVAGMGGQTLISNWETATHQVNNSSYPNLCYEMF